MPSRYPRLTSRQHPVVQSFRRLAQRRRGETSVLLDGLHLIQEALHANVPLRSILVTADFLEHASPADLSALSSAARAGAALYEGPPAVVGAASPVRTPSGIVAIAEWSPVDCATALAHSPALAIGLVDVQDPGNVGAAIRSADALGATGVVAIDGTADPGGWKALRGAMGSTFRVPVARASQPDVLAEAGRARLRVLATVAEHATPVSEVDLGHSVLVLLGHEGAGLPDSIIERSDGRLTVPMRAGVNSLNVAVTVALILYEAGRQRAPALSGPRGGRDKRKT